MEQSTRFLRIDDGPNQGLWCVYCSKKIIPRMEGGTLVTACTCSFARAEQSLLDDRDKTTEVLGRFYEQMSYQIRHNELGILIDSAGRQIDEWKRELCQLTDKEVAESKSKKVDNEFESDFEKYH